MTSLVTSSHHMCSSRLDFTSVPVGLKPNQKVIGYPHSIYVTIAPMSGHSVHMVHICVRLFTTFLPQQLE